MDLRKGWRLGTVIAATALVTAGTQYAVASSGDDAGTEAQTTVSAALGAQRVVVVREDAASTSSSTSFATLASAPVTIPAGQRGLLVARFSAESLCSGSTGWCSVRILVDGTEMVPQSGTDFAFDSPGDTWESHAVERVWSGTAAGTHTVTVQQAVVAGATSLRLDDWVFDVAYWRQA